MSYPARESGAPPPIPPDAKKAVGLSSSAPTGDTGAVSPETRETPLKLKQRVEFASDASWDHPDRNEDSIVGDESRSAAEASPNSDFDIHTKPQFIEGDKERLRESAAVELEHAEKLKMLGVSAVLDGLSGKKLGEGMMASRIAGAEIAKRMAQLTTDSSEQETTTAIREAFQSANAEVAWTKGVDLPDSEKKPEHLTAMNMNSERQEELQQLGCTMEIMRTVKTPEGKTKVVFGHAGDGAILHFDARTGTLNEKTKSHSAVELALKKGAITDSEYEDIMSKDEARWPDRIKNLKSYGSNIRQAPLGAIDGKPNSERMEAANLFMKLMDAGNQPHGEVGVTEQDLLQIDSFEVNPGDMVLQCSDGLIDNIPLDVIADKLRQGKTMEQIKTDLTWEATERGGGGMNDQGEPIPARPEAKGSDDITLVMTQFESDASHFKQQADTETELDLEDIEIIDEEIEEIDMDDVEIIDDEADTVVGPPPLPPQ